MPLAVGLWEVDIAARNDKGKEYRADGTFELHEDGTVTGLIRDPSGTGYQLIPFGAWDSRGMLQYELRLGSSVTYKYDCTFRVGARKREGVMQGEWQLGDWPAMEKTQPPHERGAVKGVMRGPGALVSIAGSQHNQLNV
jgi:hypothetical protein